MKVVADLHFHSKYSRAVSPQMILPEIVRWSKLKGLDLISTTDFTHPLWLRELKENLKETGKGVYRLKGQDSPLFIFSTEISSIYSQGGRLRRIHLLLLAPSLEEAAKIQAELTKRGNVASDGRPIFGLSAKDLTELILSLSPEALIIPAHAWTPHFAVFGSNSGFDSLEECFGKMSSFIYAVETGMSSDPAMNWQIQELETRSIVSFSDAHSGPKLGREATVFVNKDPSSTFQVANISYDDLRQAVIGKTGKLKIGYTIEFYPEEGKYHFTGHRNCKVKQSPEETKKYGTICPVCGRKLTVGVMHRVSQLATRQLEATSFLDKNHLRWITHPDGTRPPYLKVVPLLEIISQVLKTKTTSQKVYNEYINFTRKLGNELAILTERDLDQITKATSSEMTEAILKVRSGDISVDPGFDGLYGAVSIWPEGKRENYQQDSLF